MAETVRMFRSWRGFHWMPADVSGSRFGQIVRVAVVVAALAALVYCGEAAWDVLMELRAIRLSQCRKLLDALTVGDVVLCLVGWGLGREIVRVVVNHRR